jgi:serine/threonine-protein kinase
MYQLFGPFRLLRRIGMGEMAEVFVATRVATRQPPMEQRPMAGDAPSDTAHRGPMDLIAVKRISREMSSYPELLELFAKEGRLATRFDHPNVVRTMDTGEVGGRPYMAMEYVPGADLAHLRDRVARSPPGPAVRVILDMCRALQYVHDLTGDAGRPLNIVHGDVTPANILLSVNGVAKISDFSVASSSARDPGAPPGTTTVRGTYAYMSPEQVRGQPMDRRSDVFALGVVLWELLSGKRLFRRRASYLTLAAVVEDEAPPLAAMSDAMLGQSTAAAMDPILSRSLAKDRDKRYGRAAELAAALEPVAQELGWDLRQWTLQTTVRDGLSEKTAW